MIDIIKSKRHQKALEYALEQIKKSPLNEYIAEIYLYGSCARGEEKYSSDVDIFIVLSDEYYKNREKLQNYLIRLKSDVFDASCYNNPDVQLTTGGTDWKEKQLPDARVIFYKNIMRDGKRICLN